MAAALGVFLAIVLHVAFILFGGLLFLRADEDQGSLKEVELLSAAETEEDEPPEEEPQPRAEASDELETEVEEAPDAAEILRSLELSAVAAAPALEAASLSAIEDALRGQGGGGLGLGDAMSFSSGGRIGGTGKVGGLDEQLESAFSLSEIDQKPRAVFQASPLFPSEMRGKKLEGVVTVIFVVDAAGKVAEPKVEQSTHQAFDRPALDAVRQWKFEPAVRGGQRVACKMRVPIRFPAS